MLSPALSHVLLPAIVAISILLMLIRPRNIPEVYWISGGSILLLLLRLVPLQLAGKAILEGLDVYLFLIGMMLLSALAREHGVFDWLSSFAIRKANKSCARLFTLIYAIGTVVTVFMSNDATAVVLTPAILAAVRKASVKPLPYLLPVLSSQTQLPSFCQSQIQQTSSCSTMACRRSAIGSPRSEFHLYFQSLLPMALCG